MNLPAEIPPTIVDRVADFMGVARDDFVEASTYEAVDMIAAHVHAHDRDLAAIPATILARAVIEVAAELFNRRAAPLGIKNFADMDGTAPIRIARDPMTAGRPILAPYLPLGVS